MRILCIILRLQRFYFMQSRGTSGKIAELHCLPLAVEVATKFFYTTRGIVIYESCARLLIQLCQHRSLYEARSFAVPYPVPQTPREQPPGVPKFALRQLRTPSAHVVHIHSPSCPSLASNLCDLAFLLFLCVETAKGVVEVSENCHSFQLILLHYEQNYCHF